MELIAQIGMTALFAFSAISMLSCMFFMLKLVRGLKPEYKYIAPLFGPFALCITKFFSDAKKSYVFKFWVSFVLLVVSFILTFQFGKNCFPEGIATYACANT